MSQNALIGGNGEASGLAVLNTDTVQGTNKVRIKIDPVSKGMLINPTATISFTMKPIGAIDENYKHVLLFAGSDGLPYPWVADSTGAVLVDM